VNSVRCAKHVERERDSVVVHQATPQGDLQVPLQPLERLDPPAKRALVFVPIWNRSWREGAILGVWLIANPVVFPEPKDDKAWATRAMLGEEMWIAKRPLDRAMALSVGAAAFNLGGIWGAYKRRLLPTAVCTVGQVTLLLAYWRELAIYYERHRDERA
jgi:hypothetical protein